MSALSLLTPGFAADPAPSSWTGVSGKPGLASFFEDT